MKNSYILAIVLLVVIFSILFGSISCSGNLQDMTDEAVNVPQNNDTGPTAETQSDGKEEDNSSTGNLGQENTSPEKVAAGDASYSGDSEKGSSTGENQEVQENQVLEVIASTGGYYPQEIKARAGIPTLLVIRSEDSYGCERAFVMPQFKFSTILPQNGDTKLDLGVIDDGIKILGVCSMGMYYFEISFE